MVELSIIYMIAVSIVTIWPGKSSNVSYGDLCLNILEVWYFFFWFYHMWRVTGIFDRCFSLMHLVWCFCDNYCFRRFIFLRYCLQICYYSSTFCCNLFLRDWLFCINWISLCFFLLLWSNLSSLIVFSYLSWHVKF